MTNFKKVVRIGKINVSYTERPRTVDVFCKIEVKDGRLSISGVEGPRHTGNCAGSCGQIRPETTEQAKAYIPATEAGWTRQKLNKFFETWKDWHLNDMRAGCEHQKGEDWNGSKQLTIYYFRLKSEIVAKRKAAEDRARACVQSGETFTPTVEEHCLAQLAPDFTSSHNDMSKMSQTAQDYYEPNGPKYDRDTYNVASKTAYAGHTKESEHPDGLLCKECSECGYKYGAAWKTEALPVEVIEFLQSLPETDKTPAWV